MKCHKTYLIMLLIWTSNVLATTPTIIIPLRSYPVYQEQCVELIKRMKKPGKIDQCLLEIALKHSPVEGILFSYAGLIQPSDHDGLVIFPRRHSTQEITLVITPQITPVPMMGNMVSHLKVKDRTQSAFYRMKHITDPQTNTAIWNVEEMEKSYDGSIPLDAVIVIAKPKNIYIPLGASFATPGQNLIVPPIYIKKGINIIKNSLYVLNISHIFGRLRFKKQALDRLYLKSPIL